MSRPWDGKYRGSYAQPPRSPIRKLLDYALTTAILALLFVVSARLNRTEIRPPAGGTIVNDGDTLTQGTERVRLLGIDAPELAQTCVKDGAPYPCGRRSREMLARLVDGKAVS